MANIYAWLPYSHAEAHSLFKPWSAFHAWQPGWKQSEFIMVNGQGAVFLLRSPEKELTAKFDKKVMLVKLIDREPPPHYYSEKARKGGSKIEEE